MQSFATPTPARATSDERVLLLAYLHRQRELVVETAVGLTDAQARWTPDGRMLPIAGIINHLTHVEWRWIDGRFLQHDFPVREEEFRLGPNAALAELIGAYWERGRRTDEVVGAASSLEIQCIGVEGSGPPAHVLLGLGEPIDLRWVLLHLIEETAHHAGHADATREMLDGGTMT
jgi:hypothetical protein